MERALLDERIGDVGDHGMAGDRRTSNDPPGPDVHETSPVLPTPDRETDGAERTVDHLVQHTDKIKHVPKEVDAMLMTAGIMGVILPGPGIPAIIAGGLALWPGAFGKLESWLVRRNPKLHRKSVQQINRFLDNLERRYPNSTNP